MKELRIKESDAREWVGEALSELCLRQCLRSAGIDPSKPITHYKDEESGDYIHQQEVEHDM